MVLQYDLNATESITDLSSLDHTYNRKSVNTVKVGKYCLYTDEWNAAVRVCAQTCIHRVKRANASRLALSSNPYWSQSFLPASIFLFLFLSPGFGLKGAPSSERQGEPGAYISKASVAALDS